MFIQACPKTRALVQQHQDAEEQVATTFYLREPGGELLASIESGESATYYHFDALGSTVLISDPSGSPVQNYTYNAWGQVLNSPATSQPYQFVGQLGYYTHHPGQGAEVENWLQLGVRFYQPELGRFDRRDPVTIFGRSLYSYTVARPMTEVDPTGEVCGPPGCIAACIAAHRNDRHYKGWFNEVRGWCHSICAYIGGLGCDRMFNLCTSRGDTAWGHICMDVYLAECFGK